jgi:hypothetical protein
MKMSHKKFLQRAVAIALLGFPFTRSGKGFSAQELLPVHREHKQPQVISPETVQGCYELGLLKWQPDLNLGEDAKFIIPPERIQLLAERGTNNFEARGYLVRPAPGVPPSIHRSSYWKPVGPDKIEVVWGEPFSGVIMKLRFKDGTLKGKAQTFWDFLRRGQTAKIIAPKIDCNQAGASH